MARKKIRVGGGEEEERASVTLRFSDRREGDAGEEGRQILERWRPTGRGKALRQRRRRRLRWRLRWRLTSLGHSRLFRSLLFFPFSRASFSAFFLVSREHHCETERALCFGEKVFGGEARATNTTTLRPSLTKDKKTHPPPSLSLSLSPHKKPSNLRPRRRPLACPAWDPVALRRGLAHAHGHGGHS